MYMVKGGMGGPTPSSMYGFAAIIYLAPFYYTLLHFYCLLKMALTAIHLNVVFGDFFPLKAMVDLCCMPAGLLPKKLKPQIFALVKCIVG